MNEDGDEERGLILNVFVEWLGDTIETESQTKMKTGKSRRIAIIVSVIVQLFVNLSLR